MRQSSISKGWVSATYRVVSIAILDTMLGAILDTILGTMLDAILGTVLDTILGAIHSQAYVACHLLVACHYPPLLIFYS